jgi:hypothetical protein
LSAAKLALERERKLRALQMDAIKVQGPILQNFILLSWEMPVHSKYANKANRH